MEWKKKQTLPEVKFTMWTELSFEPVIARVESELNAKHVSPSVWYGWPEEQSCQRCQTKQSPLIFMVAILKVR